MRNKHNGTRDKTEQNQIFCSAACPFISIKKLIKRNNGTIFLYSTKIYKNIKNKDTCAHIMRAYTRVREKSVPLFRLEEI